MDAQRGFNFQILNNNTGEVSFSLVCLSSLVRPGHVILLNTACDEGVKGFTNIHVGLHFAKEFKPYDAYKFCHVNLLVAKIYTKYHYAFF